MKFTRILCLAGLALLALCLVACEDLPEPADTTATAAPTTSAAAPVTTDEVATPATTEPTPQTTAPQTTAPVTTAPRTTAPVTTAPVTTAPAPSATELIDAANERLANRREPYGAVLSLEFSSSNPLIALLMPDLDVRGTQFFDGENAAISFEGFDRTTALVIYGDTAYASLPTDGGENAKYKVAVDEDEKRGLLDATVTLPATDLSAFDTVTVSTRHGKTAITARGVDSAVLTALNASLDAIEEQAAELGLTLTATDVVTTFTLLDDGSFQSIALTVECEVTKPGVPLTLPASLSLLYTLDYESGVSVNAPADADAYLPTTYEDILAALSHGE